MKKLIITEDEKKDILSKYTEANDRLLVYLRRNYPVIELQERFWDLVGKYSIIVDDKSIPVENNFSRIVDKIDLEVVHEFPELTDKVRRQTIKKYVKNFEG
jgi:hypothetical protein